MKICAKEARRLKSKIEFRRPWWRRRRNGFGLPGAVRSLRIFEEVVVDLVEELARLGKALKWKVYYLIGVLSKRRPWAFSLFKQIRFRPGIHQPFRGILRFNFTYETDFWANSLLLKKAARCQPFLAVVRCLFHNHLRLKRSSLLNVYLN